MRTRTIAAALVILAGVSGCTAEPDRPTATSSPTESATPSESPAAPAAGITAAGIGAVRLATPAEEAIAAAEGEGSTLEPFEACPVDRVRLLDGGETLLFLILDEALTTVEGLRLQSADSEPTAPLGPETELGARLGQPFDEVLGRYPDAEVVDDGFLPSATVVLDGDIHLTFWSASPGDSAPVFRIDLFPGARLFYETCGG